jgi:hypothetical protein
MNGVVDDCVRSGWNDLWFAAIIGSREDSTRLSQSLHQACSGIQLRALEQLRGCFPSPFQIQQSTISRNPAGLQYSPIHWQTNPYYSHLGMKLGTVWKHCYPWRRYGKSGKGLSGESIPILGIACLHWYYYFHGTKEEGVKYMQESLDGRARFLGWRDFSQWSCLYTTRNCWELHLELMIGELKKSHPTWNVEEAYD